MLRTTSIIALYVLIIAVSTYISFEFVIEGTKEVILRNTDSEITHQWKQDRGTIGDKIGVSAMLSIVGSIILSAILLNWRAILKWGGKVWKKILRKG